MRSEAGDPTGGGAMKPGPLDSFLDLNGDGKIDASENALGYMMFREIFKDDEPDADEDDGD
jgi:hypothetical protein